MAAKPSVPKGTRDFGPIEVSKRNYIIETIKSNFKKYGFQPIETPSFENYETLMGKYGEEGDRLIFKILNSGDYLSKVPEDQYVKRDSNQLIPFISEKALRYDLTVPFARYVVQHQNEIDFPFKRYQIQPVWRADRPQKGRFREFFQCDADVVGSNSLWQEVEFIQLYDDVFSSLGLEGCTIKINNRKILSGIAEIMGAQDKLIDFTVALDKLDKIGKEKVEAEMLSKGIGSQSIEKLTPLFNLSGDFSDKLDQLRKLLSISEIGIQGVNELAFIDGAFEKLNLKSSKLVLDVTLARGLNYYTGAIFEVSAPEGVQLGSIGGGGRYDDLTGIFGLKDLSGIGISFGLDRIYLAIEQLDIFPITVTETTKVLFVNFGQKEAMKAMQAISLMRSNGISSELFPDDKKPNKQLAYADKRNIPYVILLGDEELKAGKYTLKIMKTGEQQTLTIEELIKVLK
ncbi:histidine--tRNA ligase [Aegicerativicinus sediminis]|uniref:histidine--tRNA ligase n=1 Tax=Aegicerativicinus sediminis TaxID=2893202 RepID=UPI001E3B05CB|nr:histidine--tRNA ligase [Aegicerativicinus sediminis]